jgi:glutaredoxin
MPSFGASKGVLVALCVAFSLKLLVLAVKVASAHADTVPVPAASAARPQPPGFPDVPIVMYSASWCGVCRNAKAWMATQGIVYEDRDVDDSPSNESAMRALNPRGGVPTFDIGGEVMVGFSPRGLVAAMQRAAHPR